MKDESKKSSSKVISFNDRLNSSKNYIEAPIVAEFKFKNKNIIEIYLHDPNFYFASNEQLDLTKYNFNVVYLEKQGEILRLMDTDFLNLISKKLKDEKIVAIKDKNKTMRFNIDMTYEYNGRIYEYVSLTGENPYDLAIFLNIKGQRTLIYSFSDYEHVCDIFNAYFDEKGYDLD